MRSPEILSFVMRPLKRLFALPQYALLVAALSIGTGCAGARPCESSRSQTKAERLIVELKERYLSCASYEDTGKVTVYSFSESSRRTHCFGGTFETSFDRPSGGFRFTYKDTLSEKYESAIWRRTPGTVRTWSLLDEEPREEELASGIHSFVGVSHGSSRIIPGMLFGFGVPFRDSSLRIDGEEAIDGVPCFRLIDNGKDMVSIWIGQDDRALRRTFVRTRIRATPEDLRFVTSLLPPDFSDEVRAKLIAQRSEYYVYETTIEYVPRFNRPIDPSRFAFAVPPTTGKHLTAPPVPQP